MTGLWDEVQSEGSELLEDCKGGNEEGLVLQSTNVRQQGLVQGGIPCCLSISGGGEVIRRRGGWNARSSAFKVLL